MKSKGLALLESIAKEHPANIETKMLYGKTQHMGIVCEAPKPVGPGQIMDPMDMLAYVLAGNAVFTVRGKKERYTYKVRKSDDGRVYFVAVMTGPDNETDYVYAGVIRDKRFELTKKSKMDFNTPSVRAFVWFWKNLRDQKGDELAKVEFWHEGRCGRCGRKLTVPASIARGIGPECANLMEGA